MNVIQFNKFAKFHNGKNVFFCKTDFLPALFQELQDYATPSVLISGNSDYPITNEIVSVAPKCIKKWFGQSMVSDSPIVQAMPYGIENTVDCLLKGHGIGHGRHYKIQMAENPPSRSSSRNIYANFSLDTHPIRRKVNNICENKDYITDRIAKSHTQINNTPYQLFISEILDHKMTICPRGNAPADSHRFWEVLYMDRVPIVKRNKGLESFLDLPVVCLDDWNELESVDLINEKYKKVKNNSREMLDMSYWENKILNAIKQQ